MQKTKGSVDRRVARTRAMLHQTLMSLIVKQGDEAITIRDICDAANVGRSTFYAHYTSKDVMARAERPRRPGAEVRPVGASG
jgi:AcrR family transcriptional regulator